jgi:hypothetical protein
MASDSQRTDATRKLLAKGDLAVFDAPKKIKLDAAGQIAIETQSGSVHDLDVLYPALGCTVRSELCKLS